MKKAIFLLLAITLYACMNAASAFDTDLLKDLPGEWMLLVDVATEAENSRLENLAFLTLRENGNASLRCLRMDGTYAFSCEGKWSFDYLPDAMDQLTLWFTSTDDPAQQGAVYDLKCVYNIYMESWVEYDAEITYLIFEPNTCSAISPFEELYDFDDPAFCKRSGPNMRIVNCKEYVSLREKRSTSSKRLAKVPLGALVLAYPQYGDENGFISCVYHDEYGYILAEYLEPVVVSNAGDEPGYEMQQMLTEMGFANVASGKETDAVKNAQRYLSLPETGIPEDDFQFRLYDLYATATGMMEGDGLDPEELREIYPLSCSWKGENEWGGVYCYRHLEEERVAVQLEADDPPRALELMLTERLCGLWERDILTIYDEWEASLTEENQYIPQEQRQIFETTLEENRLEWKRQGADAALQSEALWLEAQGIDLCFDLHGMERNE